MAKKTTKRSPKTHRNGKGDNGTPDRNGMIQQPLTDENVDERGRSLAKMYTRLEKHVTEKREFNKRKNAAIRELEETCNDLAEQIETGMEWVPAQQELVD